MVNTKLDELVPIEVGPLMRLSRMDRAFLINSLEVDIEAKEAQLSTEAYAAFLGVEGVKSLQAEINIYKLLTGCLGGKAQ